MVKWILSTVVGIALVGLLLYATNKMPHSFLSTYVAHSRSLLTAPHVASTTSSVATSKIMHRTLLVRAEVPVKVNKETFLLSLGVQNQGADAAVVGTESRRVVDRAVKALAKSGIASGDMHVGALHMAPIWNPSSKGGLPATPGLRASETVTVLVRKLSQLPTLMDTALRAGINKVSGHATYTSGQTLVSGESSAVAAAFIKAHQKAQSLAKAMGITLGEVVSVHVHRLSFPRHGSPNPEAMLTISVRYRY